MPPKTARRALADMLEDLTKQDYDKFCRQLLDRREEPRVRRNKVEGKNFLDIADTLVSTFTDPIALGVAVKILKEIDCNKEADRLVEDSGDQSSKPGSSDATKSSAGPAGVNTMTGDKCTDEHFVDKYQVQLKQRVHNISPILDELLFKKVISQESYDQIRALPTSQEKMRELYCSCLKAGTACKDIFYDLLRKYEQYLIDDLETKN